MSWHTPRMHGERPSNLTLIGRCRLHVLQSFALADALPCTECWAAHRAHGRRPVPPGTVPAHLAPTPWGRITGSVSERSRISEQVPLLHLAQAPLPQHWIRATPPDSRKLGVSERVVRVLNCRSPNAIDWTLETRPGFKMAPPQRAQSQ